jgi:hypothetical protein
MTPGQKTGGASFCRGIVELVSEPAGPSSKAGWFDRRLGVCSIGMDSVPDQPFCSLLEI